MREDSTVLEDRWVVPDEPAQQPVADVAAKEKPKRWRSFNFLERLRAANLCMGGINKKELQWDVEEATTSTCMPCLEGSEDESLSLERCKTEEKQIIAENLDDIDDPFVDARARRTEQQQEQGQEQAQSRKISNAEMVVASKGHKRGSSMGSFSLAGAEEATGEGDLGHSKMIHLDDTSWGETSPSTGSAAPAMAAGAARGARGKGQGGGGAAEKAPVFLDDVPVVERSMTMPTQRQRPPRPRGGSGGKWKQFEGDEKEPVATPARVSYFSFEKHRLEVEKAQYKEMQELDDLKVANKGGGSGQLESILQRSRTCDPAALRAASRRIRSKSLGSGRSAHLSQEAIKTPDDAYRGELSTNDSFRRSNCSTNSSFSDAMVEHEGGFGPHSVGFVDEDDNIDDASSDSSVDYCGFDASYLTRLKSSPPLADSLANFEKVVREKSPLMNRRARTPQSFQDTNTSPFGRSSSDRPCTSEAKTIAGRSRAAFMDGDDSDEDGDDVGLVELRKVRTVGGPISARRTSTSKLNVLDVSQWLPPDPQFLEESPHEAVFLQWEGNRSRA